MISNQYIYLAAGPKNKTFQTEHREKFLHIFFIKTIISIGSKGPISPFAEGYSVHVVGPEVGRGRGPDTVGVPEAGVHSGLLEGLLNPA